MPAVFPFAFRPSLEKFRMFGKSVFFRNFSYHSARIPEGERPCGNAFRNDGSRTDHTPLPDRHPGQNGHVSAEPAVISDRNRLAVFEIDVHPDLLISRKILRSSGQRG